MEGFVTVVFYVDICRVAYLFGRSFIRPLIQPHYFIMLKFTATYAKRKEQVEYSLDTSYEKVIDDLKERFGLATCKPCPPHFKPNSKQVNAQSPIRDYTIRLDVVLIGSPATVIAAERKVMDDLKTKEAVDIDEENYDQILIMMNHELKLLHDHHTSAVSVASKGHSYTDMTASERTKIVVAACFTNNLPFLQAQKALFGGHGNDDVDFSECLKSCMYNDRWSIFEFLWQCIAEFNVKRREIIKIAGNNSRSKTNDIITITDSMALECSEIACRYGHLGLLKALDTEPFFGTNFISGGAIMYERCIAKSFEGGHLKLTKYLLEKWQAAANFTTIDFTSVPPASSTTTITTPTSSLVSYNEALAHLSHLYEHTIKSPLCYPYPRHFDLLRQLGVPLKIVDNVFGIARRHLRLIPLLKDMCRLYTQQQQRREIDHPETHERFQFDSLYSYILTTQRYYDEHGDVVAKYKADKKAVEEFQADQERKYTHVRYTTSVSLNITRQHHIYRTYDEKSTELWKSILDLDSEYAHPSVDLLIMDHLESQYRVDLDPPSPQHPGRSDSMLSKACASTTSLTKLTAVIKHLKRKRQQEHPEIEKLHFLISPHFHVDSKKRARTEEVSVI